MYENKKIIILGMARSGYEVAKLLSSYHNEIIITDQKEQDKDKVKELEGLGITYIVTDNPEDLFDSSFDFMVKNPGIRKDHKAVLKARKLGIPVINELEVAYHFIPKDTIIIGITGSNGKTTTTTMIYEILKKAGLSVFLAGNIGLPLSYIVSKMKPKDYLVIEISDHQLLDMYDFKTDISILTNLSEVHLDFHGTYENYKAVKKKIFQHHTKEDLAIINGENKDVLEITKDILSTKEIFSKKEGKDATLKDGYLLLHGKKIINIDDIKIKGEHNYENIMCALLVLDHLGIDMEFAKQYLKEFKGVEHRMEYVSTKNGVIYYNDSKSTNIESTITALKSFSSPILLLLGGLDRGHSFDPLLPYMKHVKKIVCFGETKDRILKWAKDHSYPCIKKDTLKEALHTCVENAEKEDTILLSPACASWDQYKCFEDRGEEFKNEIYHLK